MAEKSPVVDICHARLLISDPLEHAVKSIKNILSERAAKLVFSLKTERLAGGGDNDFRQ